MGFGFEGTKGSDPDGFYGQPTDPEKSRSTSAGGDREHTERLPYYDDTTPEPENFYNYGRRRFYAGIGGNQITGDMYAANYENLASKAEDRAGVHMGDYGQNAARVAQTDSLGLMRAAAQGQAPSAAEIQMRQGVDLAAKNQMAQAAAARGGPMAQIAAQRMAAMQGAQMQQQGVSNSAALRAQEMAAARQAYGQMSNATRQSSLQEAQAQAMLDDAQRARNDQYSSSMRHLGFGVQQADLGAQMQQLGYQQQQSQFDANRTDQYVSAGAGLLGTGIMAAAMMSDINAKQDISPVNSGSSLGISMPGAPDKKQLAASQGVLDAVKAQQDAKKLAASSQIASGMKGATAGFGHTQTLNVPQYQNGLGAGPGADMTDQPFESAQFMSDENAKSTAGSEPIDGLLRAFKESASTYSYKDPSMQPTAQPKPAGSRFAGIMAQRVEQVPEIGHSLVSDTPNGKAIEAPAMLSALTAAVGRQQQELDELRGKKGGK